MKMNLKRIFLAFGIFISMSVYAQQINPITLAMFDGYKQLLDENPKDYFTLYQRSAQYYRLSMYDLALTDIEKAITYTPEKETEMLSQEYVLARYPHKRPLLPPRRYRTRHRLADRPQREVQTFD